MSRLHKTGAAALAVLFILAVVPPQAHAKGPGKKGGRSAGKRISGYRAGGGHRISQGRSVHRAGKHTVPVGGKKAGVTRSIAGPSTGGHPWSMQRANEQRKLDHRMGIADKLDRIAQQNGNERLHETAQRKREKAMQLFEKRMAKIDSKDPALAGPGIPEPALSPETALDNPTWSPDTTGLFEQPMFSPPDPIADAPGAFDQLPADLADQRLLGPENALMRQLTNEQRKLSQQMELADRLWEVYERTGNERLADAARKLEERALTRFDQRMDAISDFQQRHGLLNPDGGDLINPAP